MATIYHQFEARAGEVRTTAFPGFTKRNGTNFPVAGYAFDAASEEALFFIFRAVAYGSGNLTVDFDWYADTATTGAVMWGTQLAVLTQNTDTTDAETKAFAAQNTATQTHPGTTAHRLLRASVTATNLDSIAANSWVMLRASRVAANAGDTMAGDAILTLVTVSYSDT